uniref:28S ribosomal protein S34, mitochondrial n=1 Tax=Aceria tosichella TaxID=561515 RepID=A0A6G1S4C8_9ACAR
MPKVYYYGKKTKFVGKTLFEILANLRNFGLNRMLIKQEELLLHPGKSSYYVVKKVEPVMDDKLQEGAIYAERIFKGAKMPGLVMVDDTTWHTDWQLIPKHEESKYKVENPPEFQPAEIDRNSFEVPPLMDAFLKRHLKNKGQRVPQERIQIQLDYKPSEIDYGIDVSQPIKSMLAERFRRSNKRT